ncbi:MAG TPA: hypothetical protein PKG54_03400 [Phycisphaerae bacterium]|jgi:hypothetical protein|nr:hypothetical protein [Phycisphaerae bacterium]HOB73551.1 hypothetical protein [Phycisphaerae bacterium]HOJ54159.1 hypothetical protein [Phycisphaerae bacterium]HOL25548.1 hypothetical protein [Phycisphaerae bacterium]HPP21019.1 hypothetical protein [Phycisphaerae bacterium]
MSEYQYYEFLAVDKPLTDYQIQQVRRYSSRADITSTRFVNVYDWGDFRGDVEDFLKRFFDLHVYVANWGTRHFAFRIPKEFISVASVEDYVTQESLTVIPTDEHVIFYLSSDTEDYEEWDDMDDGSGWMASLAPVREEVISGDYRALYLAWLADAQWSEPELEPPVPAGLQSLSAAQKALADFLRLDEDVLSVAMQASPPLGADRSDMAEWIAALPEAEKNQILLALCDGSDPQAAVKLRRRFNVAQAQTRGQPAADSRRTVGSILAAARRLTEERERQEASRRAEAQARREAEAAKARAEYLAGLAKREPAIWRQVEELIEMKQRKRYDEAVTLLSDLSDLARQSGTEAQFADRIADLKNRYASRRVLLQLLTQAGLISK